MDANQLGKFTLLEHMGKGGVGSVYRAVSSEDGAIVAIKVFESGPDRPPEMSRKLRDREVRMLVAVQHPNIVQFREVGQLEDDYYYAMEFVENSLLKRMRGGNDFDLADKVLILRQSASALAAIHHMGIVHRDIKPGNMLLDQDPSGAIHVKLTDLGIAKNVSETDIVREQMPTRVPGTPKYLSPEQIRLQAVDGRTDVFGLGVVAYELITGRPPFVADTPEAYLTANAQQQQQPACQVDPGVPDYLSGMIDRMLAKDRQERYDSDSLSRDLELAQQHLISGAEMVERTDPGSMFYEPPPAEAGPARQPFYRLVTPTAWALAAAVLLVAAGGAVFQLRPAASAQEGAPPSAHAAGFRDWLAEAEDAAAQGRYWHAYALAEAHGAAPPADGRERLDALVRTAREAVAEEAYQDAAVMLSQGRTEEAKIVLSAMTEMSPEAPRTAELAAALQREQRPEPVTDEWERELHDTYALVRRGRFAEALEVRKRLLEASRSDPAKLNLARRAVADLMASWASQLLRGSPTQAEMEEFLSALEGNDAPADRAGLGLTAQVRLRLADLYRKRGEHEAALKQYEMAADSGDAGSAERARTAMGELRAWLAQQPLDVQAVAAGLERQGFEADLWGQHAEPGGAHSLDGAVLTLSARADARPVTVYWETARPVRNLGFSAGVSFRTNPAFLQRPGSSRTGMVVSDTRGTTYEIAFDGRAYSVSYKSGRGSAGSVIRREFGDEGRAWHAMAVRYAFDTGMIAVSLDGQDVHRFPLDLADFRLRVFLTANPGADAAADFQDAFCRP